ncbi:MAG: tripartite tricarboxylate transporter substrate-binding protein [Polaromonas sp.]|uniref:tripartite tricarboxylate transporter substrate-binding protein n=1 Tax=Polaromonas sp. TaxID=1869339 RepID=UPI002489CAAB|nr:tripartite tricarboxylate transporter substrate-binding protein [Polaromonas sp.]MDI1269707.1 tripartite tricarboxylate transporter substrate-binding protein [Polaromonas sp.]MDP2448064.1 tripartite tricarboxylate transporter substrate-binding protein [Polaromonas sp.]MDP3249293.1 tripartite tricarboxylate transporter substrate-binding protein [Polaromonas sp.]
MKRLLVLAAAATALFANAQTYPGSKPIAIVVPFAAGGPTDRVARDLAEAMRKNMPGANFVVENVNGAGGTIAATKVAKATPDGHTLLLHHIGMASAPALYRKLQYKPLEDFEYLGMINEVPMTLIGKPQLPANTYRDFENYIKANAGKLNIAHAGLGSASHLCGLMWQAAINAKEAMTTIPFGGTGPAMNALVGGQVDLMCDQTTNTTGQIEAGRVKAFAVTTAKPLSSHKLLKDYPSLQDMGLKGFNLTIWHGLYAPKGTSPAIQAQLNTALKLALKDPDFIKKQEGLGAIVVTDKRVEPAAHKAFVASEIAKLKPVIEAAGKFAD